METAFRQNHVYPNNLAQTVQASIATVEFERQRYSFLEGRMDEYQRLGFDLNQSVQTMKMAWDTRPEDATTINRFSVLEATLQSLQPTVAKAGTAVEQNAAAVEKT